MRRRVVIVKVALVERRDLGRGREQELNAT